MIGKVMTMMFRSRSITSFGWCLLWVPVLLLHGERAQRNLHAKITSPVVWKVFCEALIVPPMPYRTRTTAGVLTNIPSWPKKSRPRRQWRFDRTTIQIGSAKDNSDSSQSPSQTSSPSLEELQAQLSYIEALEERNKAQFDSFVDEQDQWESLEPFEQELLLSKDSVVEQIEKLRSDE